MTANVDIKRGDLHLAVSTAFNRGRYVLMTDGAGRPTEVTLDLKERPDDLLGSEPMTIDELRDIFERPFDGPEDPRIMAAQAMTRREAQAVLDHSGDLAEALTQPTDDHGPTIPAQGGFSTGTATRKSDGTFDVVPDGPRVYEFALQDVRETPLDRLTGTDVNLGNVELCDAPDALAALRADWVHVYDRVTRERRTLKRPESDRILTGLQDVAADLRRQSFEGSDPSKPYDGSGMVKGMADLSPLIVTRDGVPCEDQGAALEEFKARCTRGAPVDPPFGCAPLPPVGPLTSVEGVQIGDVVRASAGVGVVKRVYYSDGSLTYERGGKTFPTGYGEEIDFVGRPDADGWMTWAGGENPVPGAVVEVRTSSKGDFSGASETMDWSDMGESGHQIVAFRIVDTPPAV